MKGTIAFLVLPCKDCANARRLDLNQGGCRRLLILLDVRNLSVAVVEVSIILLDRFLAGAKSFCLLNTSA